MGLYIVFWILVVIALCVCVLAAVGKIRAKLCACNDGPNRKGAFYLLIAGQYAAAVGAICIQAARPYTLTGGINAWHINPQIPGLLIALYAMSLLMAFNYEALDVRTMLRRLLVYATTSAALLLMGQWVNEKLFSEVMTFNGTRHFAYTHRRRIADAILAILPTFFVFYGYARGLFPKRVKPYKQLFYSILPLFLAYALAVFVYLRYELLTGEERDKIGTEIGAFG